MNERTDDAEAGFTLIEVLVALAIFSISIAVLLSLFSDGLTRLRTSQSETVAGSLVQSLADEVGVTRPLQPGDVTGEFNNGFHWRLHAEPYGTAEDARAWPVQAYKVTASVVWRDGVREKSRNLTFLRFAPKARQP